MVGLPRTIEVLIQVSVRRVTRYKTLEKVYGTGETSFVTSGWWMGR